MNVYANKQINQCRKISKMKQQTNINVLICIGKHTKCIFYRMRHPVTNVVLHLFCIFGFIFIRLVSLFSGARFGRVILRLYRLRPVAVAKPPRAFPARKRSRRREARLLAQGPRRAHRHEGVRKVRRKRQRQRPQGASRQRPETGNSRRVSMIPLIRRDASGKAINRIHQRPMIRK